MELANGIVKKMLLRQYLGMHMTMSYRMSSGAGMYDTFDDLQTLNGKANAFEVKKKDHHLSSVNTMKYVTKKSFAFASMIGEREK